MLVVVPESACIDDELRSRRRITTYEVGATTSTAEIFQSTRFLSYFVLSAEVFVLVLVLESPESTTNYDHDDDPQLIEQAVGEKLSCNR